MFSFSSPVVLLGGGQCALDTLQQLLQRSYPLVVADGGANHLDDLSVVPEMIIGDLDSLNKRHHWESITRVVELEEQDTTDFEKCLYSVVAPLYFAMGFTGRRLDHTLASLHVVAKYSIQKRVVLMGEDDIVFVCRNTQQITLNRGMRFSIYPLEPVKFLRSSGLLYPLDGLTLAPTAMIGTSNEVIDEQVTLETEPENRGAYAVILSIEAFGKVVDQMT